MSLITVVLLAILLFVFYSYFESKRRRIGLPPGPPADPIIGCLRRYPHHQQHKAFASWSKQYGDVIYVSLFSKSIVILNSAKAAHDLLDKRSIYYSDRPRLVLFVEMMGWDNIVTNFQYGPRFRKHRKLIQDQFNPTAIPDFHAVQFREIRVLLNSLLKSPDMFLQHLSRFAAGSIIRLAYGHTVNSFEDPYLVTARRTTKATVEGASSAMLVDFFPLLKHIPTWMPGSAFKRNALAIRASVNNMFSAPLDQVKQQMKMGTATPSLASNLLEACRRGPDAEIDPEDEHDAKGVAGVLYGAAVDTTTATLSAFLLAMTIHPDICRLAQAEIDAVIGPDRLPTLADRDTLPYLECILKETYRWNPVAPLAYTIAIPHKASADDVYRGYRIPKNATVIANVWAMTHDPDVYPNPNIFLPSRFATPTAGTDPAQNLKEPAPDPREVVFGFGRRACAGRAFADNNVWLAVAAILSTFTIDRARDERGREEIPDAEFTDGVVSHAKPFRCVICPRSSRAVELVSREYAEVEGDLDG